MSHTTVVPSNSKYDLSKRLRVTASATSAVVCSRQWGMSNTKSCAMSRSRSKAACTTSLDQHVPIKPWIASSATEDWPCSIPITSIFWRKWACSLSERWSSSTIWASSSKLRASKYSRTASLTSERNWRASPEPHARRECIGVSRCTFRINSTPIGPPNRIRLALLKNSADRTSCLMAAVRSSTKCLCASGLACANCSVEPRSREKPSWMSASSITHSSWGLWSCCSIARTKARFSANMPCASMHAVQNAGEGGCASRDIALAANTTS
mmetsp:Transcript_3945/g.8032  ORF Transcript_3945/g.8032 Transcript_3945/m.8032 type:complete len:268 (-) Transcript_3945:778-1581(-)